MPRAGTNHLPMRSLTRRVAYATPAIVNSRIYIRTGKELLCVGTKTGTLP